MVDIKELANLSRFILAFANYIWHLVAHLLILHLIEIDLLLPDYRLSTAA
jgi:hypothetical protein